MYFEYNRLEGTQQSRRCLINDLNDRLSPDLLVLSSPGIASILIFRSTTTSLLRIVDEVDTDKCSRNILYLSERIKADCPFVDT